jgi:hypothetical protein
MTKAEEHIFLGGLLGLVNYCLFVCLFVFGSTGVCIQGLLLARQVPSPFCFSYFSNKVLQFYLGLASDQDPPNLPSQPSALL